MVSSWILENQEDNTKFSSDFANETMMMTMSISCNIMSIMALKAV